MPHTAKRKTFRRRKPTNCGKIIAGFRGAPPLATIIARLEKAGPPVKRDHGDGSCWGCGSPMTLERGVGYRCTNPECGRIVFPRGEEPHGTTSRDE